MRGSIDAEKLGRQIAGLPNHNINSSRLSNEVWVDGADDNAVMRRLSLVEADEMTAIKREHRAAPLNG